MPLGRLIRSRCYRFYTRVPDGLRSSSAGRAGTAVAQRVLGRGTIRVSAGPATGLLLDTRGLLLGHVQAYGLVRGALEPSVQEAFRRHIAPGAVVYDIGANLGFFSLLAARFGATVHAFEPSPGNAATLRRNVALNGAAVTVHEAAVGARSGRAEFLLVGEESWSHLADRGHHPGTRDEIEVDVIALDDRPDLPPPALVKIDVEGSELAVIEGMARLLADHAPVLVVELHGTNAEFVAAMERHRYAVTNLEGPERVAEAGPVHALATPQ